MKCLFKERYLKTRLMHTHTQHTGLLEYTEVMLTVVDMSIDELWDHLCILIMGKFSQFQMK